MDGRPSLNELLDHVPLTSHSKIKKLARQLGVSVRARGKDRLEVVFKEWIKHLEINGDVPTRGAVISALESINEKAIANTYVATIHAFAASKFRYVGLSAVV